MAEVGKNIKKIRKEKNLTQEDLAERIVPDRRSVIMKMERASRVLSFCWRLQGYLG